MKEPFTSDLWIPRSNLIATILLLASSLSQALPITNLSVNFENWAIGTNYNLKTRTYSTSSLPTGTLPESQPWSQVFLVKNTAWLNATNGINGHPVSVRSNAWNNGTHIARFGTASYGNLTRLISPPMNLSAAITATMTFWHAQAAWPADQDYLRILIHTNYSPFIMTNPIPAITNWGDNEVGNSKVPLQDGWQELAWYNASVTNWTQRSLVLSNFGPATVICFEGYGNYAYGICLDDLQVISESNNVVPAITRTHLVTDFENWAIGTNYNLKTRTYSTSSLPTGTFPESQPWSQVFLVKNTAWLNATNGINGHPVSVRSNAWNNGTHIARFGTASYGNLTRLISPPMNLSAAITATMTFWHAQAAWPADQDYLRILIHTNYSPFIMTNPIPAITNWGDNEVGNSKVPLQDGWRELAWYNASVTNWTQRSLVLSNFGPATVICFEGYGNYAYGICLDDLQVMTTEYEFPVDSGSNRPVFETFGWSGGTNVILRWSSFSNQLYAIYVSTNLMVGFTLISSNMPAIPPMNIYTDRVDATPQKFWKISVAP